MGGVQSRAQKMQRFNKIDPKKWEMVRKDGITQIATDQNGRQGQVNYINLDAKKSPQEELEIYYYRKTYDGPLIKCYGAEVMKANSIGVCGKLNTMKVVTERIIKKWQELPQITFPQILYSLTQALHGYSNLFEQVGAFQVNHNMLGINKQGELHVWLNQNFAQNNPSLQKGLLYTTSIEEQQKISLQSQMIQDILKLIQQKCQNGAYPQDFKQKIISNDMNFHDIRQGVNDYINNNKIQIPTKLFSQNNRLKKSKSKGMLVTQLTNSRIKKQQNIATNQITNQTKKLQILNQSYPQQKRTIINTFNQQPLLYQTKNSKQVIMTPKKQKYPNKLEQNELGLNSNPNITHTYSIYKTNIVPSIENKNQINNTNTYGYDKYINSGRKVNISYMGNPTTITNTTNTTNTYSNQNFILPNANYQIPKSLNTTNKNKQKQQTYTKNYEPMILNNVNKATQNYYKTIKNQTVLTFNKNTNFQNLNLNSFDDKNNRIQTSQVTKQF